MYMKREEASIWWKMFVVEEMLALDGHFDNPRAAWAALSTVQLRKVTSAKPPHS